MRYSFAPNDHGMVASSDKLQGKYITKRSARFCMADLLTHPLHSSFFALVTMRYSIAALSLVSPALALPTFGDLFGGHNLLGDIFSHGHSHGSSSADAPTYNGSPASYDSGPSPADSGSYGYDSGSISNNQGYNAPQGSGMASSVVDAASANTGAPLATGTPISGSGVTPSNYTLAYTTTTPTSIPAADASIPAALSSEASASSSEQTCESPDVIGCETASDSPAADVAPESVSVYDFIVVGGGTAGLVIANRLSENSYTSVAVIEAGDLVWDNHNVSTVDGYGLAFGTDIDWQYESAPQAYAGNKTQTLRAGKALGGTSTINGEFIIAYINKSPNKITGMAYLRAQAAQINAWEHLGNDGWTWESLLPYYKQSEHFQIPTEEQCAAGAAYDIAVHGTTGPLKTGWNNGLQGENVTSLINATYTSLGLPYIEEANDGSMRGFTRYPATVDQTLNVREDAGRAYYLPVQNRTNLDLYTNSVVQRMTWDEASTNSTPRVNGVIYTDASGKQRTITAKKEVILSAGALRSPLILELSGIGSSE